MQACYRDKTTNLTQVVGYIGDNTIVNFSDTVAKTARNASTIQPRSQTEILSLVSKPELVAEGWKDAELWLPVGRGTMDLPKAEECINAKIIPNEVTIQWKL